MTIQQKVTKSTWEEEFSTGKWDNLEHNPLERARHAVIGMYLNYFYPKGKFLDVGCGLGTTTDFLNSDQKSKYLGIDISETAIEAAKNHKNVNFKAIEFLKLPVEEKFDAIIFNEVLYYLEEESSLLHTQELLKEKGLIIVSLYHQKRMHYSDESIWRLYRKFFVPIEHIELSGFVKNCRLVKWRIEVLKSKNKNDEQHLLPDRTCEDLNIYFQEESKLSSSIFCSIKYTINSIIKFIYRNTRSTQTIQQKVTKEEWEKEFSAGKWDGLDRSPLERARHSVIGMYLNHFSTEGYILDVGCGLGTLTDFMSATQKSRYLGIDISETAVKEAQLQKGAKFKAIDFLKLPTEQKFDVIIFNEVLCYMDAGASIRYALKLLKEKGIIIVSQYRQKRMQYNDKLIWRLCRKSFVSIENIEINGVVKDGRLVKWHLEVFWKKKNFD
jgi:2-polyprenyl-3-methyl-5-hydroxy-6-metoxy-1,4-benzoquinol methylase